MRMASAVFATYWRIPHLRRGLSLFLLGLFGLYFAWAGLLDPARREHDAVRDRFVRAAAAQADLGARSKGARLFMTRSAQIAALDARLSASVTSSGLVEAFSELSAEAGTRIIHGSNSFGEARGAVRLVIQDLTIEGSYDQLRIFLASVAEIGSLTMLVSAELGANPDGTLVRAQLRFVTLTAGGG